MEFYNHLKLNPILRYITLILFLACTTRAADTLNPNYDDPAQQVKYFDIHVIKPLMLSCAHPNSGDHKLVWLKDGKEVTKLPDYQKRYQIHDKENKLIIPKPGYNDTGIYTCKIPELDLSADIRAISNVYINFMEKNKAFVEGEKLTLHCDAVGSQPILIQWKIGGEEVGNNTRVSLSADGNNTENAILTIEKAGLEDRNSYNCTATNPATAFNSTLYPAVVESTYIRVKGKLAALWPFLGICAEVFVLCAIILVYEKRRNKEGLDESDTDQSPEQEKLKTGK